MHVPTDVVGQPLIFIKFKDWAFWLIKWDVRVFFFFFFEKKTHEQGMGKMVLSFNTKKHHKLHSKVMVIFKGGLDKLYYTQHTLLIQTTK